MRRDGRLDKRSSLEQISRALSEEFGGDPSRQLVTESIYQAIYDPAGSLGAVCAGQLRTKRGRRRPRRRRDARRPGGLAQPALSFKDRPEHVEDRIEVGHWEGDSIMGIATRSAIAALVERVSRKVVLVMWGTTAAPPLSLLG
jgi:IS30 family transposase